MQAKNIRNGTTFDLDGKPMMAVEFEHCSGGTVKVKAKNMIKNTYELVEFNENADLKIAYVEELKADFTGKDENYHYFLDTEAYNEYQLKNDLVPEQFKFAREYTSCRISLYNGVIITATLPRYVYLKVKEIHNGIATMENGINLEVPSSVQVNDDITVDTFVGELFN